MAAALLSVVLTLPALGVGFILDDYYHRTVLLGRSRFRELLGNPPEMFRFFRGDPERTGRLIDLGLLPWWTYPGVKAEFLHAITVLTHRFDYALWPDAPWLMHAHSLLWLGALVIVTALFFRRMFGVTRAAGVAALLFALDDARGATAGFLANRNILVAATFGVGCLIAHDRARRDGARAAALLAPLLLLAALFAKEEGIGTCAYLAAYALWADPRGRGRGLLALAPYAAAVVLWASLRAAWGYGVRDVGVYIDPVTDPARFASAILARIPVLLLGQWSPIPADVGVALGPRGSAWLWLLSVAFLALLGAAMAPLLKRDRTARFWATGMLLATLPVSATVPMDRLLTFAGIGASGLLAQFWVFVFGDAAGPPARRLWQKLARPTAWFLVVVHAVLAPLVLPLRAGNPVGPRWIEEGFYVRLPLGRSLDDRTVVVANAPSPVHAGYLLLLRELNGQSGPAHIRVLAPALPAVSIRRIDARTLAVRPQGGYLRFLLDQVFRNERRPFPQGAEVRLSGMTATIDSLTADGRPDEVTFRFDVPLESDSLVWLCHRRGRFEAFTVPNVGEEVELEFAL
jgi:hypothetical protein